MKVVGIDPSSTKCGVALVDGEELLDTWVWEKTANRGSAWNLNDYFDWLVALLRGDAAEAQMACVEFLSVTRNAQTVRKVSHYQAASVLACKQRGLLVIEGMVSQARNRVLDNGGMDKSTAFKLIRKRYADHTFRRESSGGDDETDAVVLALAGPILAESG